MKKNYKFILFDLDGTITDPKLGITKSVQYALRHFNFDVTDLDRLIPFIGPPLKDSFINFYGFNETDAMKAIVKYREYFSETGIFENSLIDGMQELFQALINNNKTLIIASSKPTVFVRRILEHFGISKYFVFVSGAELDGTRSLKSEVIRYAMTQNNITEFDNVVMVGDRKHDILGAREEGIDSIGVLFGYGSPDELKNAGATYLAENTKKLYEILV